MATDQPTISSNDSASGEAIPGLEQTPVVKSASATSASATSASATSASATSASATSASAKAEVVAEDEDYSNEGFIVRARGVKKVYKIADVEVHALRGVDIDIRRGEYISIMGPSGSGKSTLFNMIGGLDKPTEGTVFIDEVDMAQLDAFELAWLRCRKIGYIFQTFNLIPVMTALENITLPMIFAGASTDEQMEKGKRLLEQVGIGHRMYNKPSQLSGGQQQRVAIARSLANNPAIILADEPTGNLDQKTGKEIIELLKKLNKESGVTVITATHDDKMLRISDRIVVVEDGQVVKITTPEEMDLEKGTVGGFH